MIRNRAGTIFGDDDPFLGDQMRVMQEFIQNAYSIRSDLINTALHSHKDVNKECDYPETQGITVLDYRTMYDRNPIGSRVVEVMPDECWQASPRVIEDEDASTTTAFEKAMSELSDSLRGEQSWLDAEEEGNPLWRYLHRADRMSGIGHFGIILIGLDDGKPLDQPVEGFKDPEPDDINVGPVFVNNQQTHKLIYVSVFGEDSMSGQDVVYETNRFSPRYRKPKYYNIDLGDSNSSSYTTVGREGRTIKVHWSRVVHIADDSDSSEIIAVPRMRPVWNNLLDLMKIYGGDAEGYWKNCCMRIFFETHPQLGGDVTIDEDTLKERMWDMENGLQRWAALLGMSAKTIAPSVVDPTPHINAQIEAICVKLAIPKRIFVGSERGELASSQDDSTWNDRVRGRRNGYCTPRIIAPFIDRLIQVGVLPEPNDKYKVIWPDPELLKPQEKADVAAKRVDAMAKYIAGQVDTIMDPMDFLTKELDYNKDEAEGILERASENAPEPPQPQEGPSSPPGATPPGPGSQPPPPAPNAEGSQGSPAPGQPGAPATQNQDEGGHQEGSSSPFDPPAGGVENQCGAGAAGSPGFLENDFCPTGKGGGVDPTCSRGGTKGGTRHVVTETDHHNAAILVSQGIRAGLKPRTGVVDEFAPGRGLENEATYVSDPSYNVGSFGGVRIHYDVPDKQLDIPQEQKQLGWKRDDPVSGLEQAIQSENGAVVRGDVPPDKILKVEVWEGGKRVTKTPQEYLKEYHGVEGEQPKLPTLKQYESTLKKHSDKLFLTDDAVDQTVGEYARASLQDKLYFAEELASLSNNEVVDNYNPGQPRDKEGRWTSGIGGKLAKAAVQVIDVLDATFDEMDPINDILDHAKIAAGASGVGVIPERAIKAVYVAGNLADNLSGTPIGSAMTAAAGGLAAALGVGNNIRNRITIWKSDKRVELDRKKQERRKQREDRRKRQVERKTGRKVGKSVAKKIARNEELSQEQITVAGERMAELWGEAKGHDDPKLWLSYFIMAKYYGSDDEEAEAISDLMAEEDLVENQCGAGAPGSPGFQKGNTCGGGGGEVIRIYSPAKGESSEPSETLVEMHKEYRKNSTKDDRKAVNSYIRGSRKINEGLRTGEFQTEKVEQEAKLIQNVLSNRPPTGSEMVVHRFQGLDPGLEIGGVVQQRGFMSTATDLQDYFATDSVSFASKNDSTPVVFSIKVPKGSTGLASVNPKETEILFKDGAKFKVVGVEKNTRSVPPVRIFVPDPSRPGISVSKEFAFTRYELEYLG